MVSAADRNTLQSKQIPWTGDPVHVAEHQYLEGSYTFGASNVCIFELEFTGVVSTGKTHKAGDDTFSPVGGTWLQIFDAANPDNMVMEIGSGFFDFNSESGQPTTSMYYIQNLAGGVRQISMPLSNASWSAFGDVSNEVFSLSVTIDRTTNNYNLSVDFRSANIILVDNYNHTSVQPDDEITPASLKFRAGSRLLQFIQSKAGKDVGAQGISNLTISKFQCTDVE